MKFNVHLLILCFVFAFVYCRTHIQIEQLNMDQGFLTLNNTNYPTTIYCKYNLVVCEHCRFERLFSSEFPMNTSQTKMIDTTYPYDIEIHNTSDDVALPICRIKSYSFDEHGSYSLEVSWDYNRSEAICQIIRIKDSGYYWTPVICAILFICCFVLIVQLCHHMYNSQYMGRILTNIGHQRARSTIAEPVIERTPSLIANESVPDDLFGMRTSISELPLVGSTRVSNNSVKISKVLPKRLKALDTFRGFSLMVMIFVNYGGRIASLTFFKRFFSIQRWWLLVLQSFR